MSESEFQIYLMSSSSSTVPTTSLSPPTTTPEEKTVYNYDEDVRLDLFIASSSIIILALITIIAVVSCFILCNEEKEYLIQQQDSFLSVTNLSPTKEPKNLSIHESPIRSMSFLDEDNQETERYNKEDINGTFSQEENLSSLILEATTKSYHHQSQKYKNDDKTTFSASSLQNFGTRNPSRNVLPTVHETEVLDPSYQSSEFKCHESTKLQGKKNRKRGSIELDNTSKKFYGCQKAQKSFCDPQVTERNSADEILVVNRRNFPKRVYDPDKLKSDFFKEELKKIHRQSEPDFDRSIRMTVLKKKEWFESL